MGIFPSMASQLLVLVKDCLCLPRLLAKLGEDSLLVAFQYSPWSVEFTIRSRQGIPAPYVKRNKQHCKGKIFLFLPIPSRQTCLGQGDVNPKKSMEKNSRLLQKGWRWSGIQGHCFPNCDRNNISFSQLSSLLTLLALILPPCPLTVLCGCKEQLFGHYLFISRCVTIFFS